MNDEHAAARTDTPGEFASGPTLTPIRRRGESHLLALMLAAALVFVAIAIAKPWGEGAPPPGASAATASLAAEMAQPGFFYEVQTGDFGESTSTYTYTVVCTEDPRVSLPVVVSAESVMGHLTVDLACTGESLQRLESVSPSPSAP